MHDIFAEIKATIPIATVFTTYGVNLDRHNRAKCPFHSGGNERTASLTVYPNTNSFYCYGCGTGGSAIDFVSSLLGLEPLAAAQKLNEDFNLGLTIGQPLSLEQRRKLEERARREAAAVSAFDSWCNSYSAFIKQRLDVFSSLLEIEKALTIKDYENGIYAMSADDYTELHLLEYEKRILNTGANDEKVDLYMCRTKGGEAS